MIAQGARRRNKNTTWWVQRVRVQPGNRSSRKQPERSWSALPLLAGRPAALEDWPSHVARVDILTQLLAGNDYWSQFYRINTFLLPNISVDFSILALHAIGLPVAVAAQVTLLATYFLFVGVASALAWALRAGDPLKPLIAVVLFYNGALMDGFVNYMMGAGVALCFLTAWVGANRPVSRLLIAL